MRILKSVVLTLLLMATVVACDSGDDESDADVFVGNWTVISIADATGDQTQTFGIVVESFNVDFEGDDTFDLTVSFTDLDPAQREPITLAGTYNVDEGSSRISLNGSLGGIPITLAFTYEIVNESTINLTIGSLAVNQLFGTAYQGNVQLTVSRN